MPGKDSKNVRSVNDFVAERVGNGGMSLFGPLESPFNFVISVVRGVPLGVSDAESDAASRRVKRNVHEHEGRESFGKFGAQEFELFR